LRVLFDLAVFDGFINGLVTCLLVKGMGNEHSPAAHTVDPEICQDLTRIFAAGYPSLVGLPFSANDFTAGETPYWNHHSLHHVFGLICSVIR